MSNSELSLAEAIEKTGVSRNTLIRAIKAGRMSGKKNEHGDYRVDAAELFRVFEPVSSPPAQEPASVASVQSESVSPTIEKLYERLIEKDDEISDLQSEIDDKEEALTELRQAYNALPSPEDVESRINAAVEKAETEKLKEIALQKQQAEKWKVALEDRQLEIEAARRDAELLKQKAAEDIATIERRAAGERAVREALEQRGLIARLLNRKPKMAEG